MIHKQFGKCHVCGHEEKYTMWIVEGNESKKVQYCKDQCMLEDKPKRKKK